MTDGIRPARPAPPAHPAVVRFGVFELDSRAGELRKRGVKLRLQGKPVRLLELLIENAGTPLTREELASRLWPDGVFVDFDHNLNSIVSRLREVLNDDAANPQFIETLPRGYRFIGSVLTTAAAPVAVASPETSHAGTAAGNDAQIRPASPVTQTTPSGRAVRRWWWGAGALVLGVAALAGVTWRFAAAPRPVAPSASETSALLVLPFQNLSGDPEQEYFSDGVTEEMIAQLGNVNPQRLVVIGRTSAMHYKHTDKRIDQIASELGVHYVLEGSVRRVGNRVRINAQLVRARDQVRLWTASYDEELQNVLAVQTEVTQAIAREIAVRFERGSDAGQSASVDPPVYEAYLKGRYFLDRSTPRSIEYFQKAIQLAPGHAGAYAGLADAYGQQGWGLYGGTSPAEVYPKALQAAERALSLAPQLAAAHVALARIRWKYEWNWQGAEASFRRALALDANAASAHESYFDFLSALGRNDEAYRELQRALTLDPVSVTVAYDFALHFARTHNYDQALEKARRAAELEPDSGFVHHLIAQALTERRQYREALDELHKALDLSPDSPHFLAMRGYVSALAGDRPGALRDQDALRARARKEYVSPCSLAMLAAGLGRKNEALTLLEAAYATHDPWLSRLRVEPGVRSLRDEPRFRALLTKLGLPPPSAQ